jgi:ubiquitin carboxyl-terminal hydrolase L5
MENDKWVPLEVDPYVATQIIKQLQVKGVQVEELITMQPSDLQPLGALYGISIILAIDYIKLKSEANPIKMDLYFCQQILYNAPLPHSILSVLLNIEGIGLPLELVHYKEFVKDISPEAREVVINELQTLKAICNSFYTPEIQNGGHKPGPMHSFITLIPYKGKIYELNSMEQYVKLICEYKGDWVESAKSRVEEIESECTRQNIAYHTLAFTVDRKEIAEERLSKNKLLLVEIKNRLGMKPVLTEPIPNELLKCIPNDHEKIEQMYKLLNEEIMQDEIIITSEQERYKLCKEEYNRRTYNYIPFIFNMLKMLSEKGKLQKAIDAAKNKQTK